MPKETILSFLEEAPNDEKQPFLDFSDYASRHLR